MPTFKISAVNARQIPDPNIKYMKKYICTVPCNLLPTGIGADKVNARKPNINKRIYKEVETTLLNMEGDENIFHHKNSGITIIAEGFQKIDDDSRFDTYLLTIDDKKRQGIADGNHTYTVISRANENPDISISDDQYVNVEIRTGVPDDLIPQISEGLNTSMQVQAKSLEDLKDNFSWIKEELDDMPWHNEVAYSENDQGSYDIRDILSIMTMLNSCSFPNYGDSHPTVAYSSKSKVLENYIDDVDKFKIMRPILKDILYLYESITCGDEGFPYGYRALWNKEGGKAAAWNATEKRSKNPHIFHIIGKEDMFRLDKAFAYPIFSSFRWFVNYDEKKQITSWKGDFKSVLNAWNENGYTLLKQTKEMSDGLGGKLTPLGRSTTLYTSLHSTMGLRSKT